MSSKQYANMGCGYDIKKSTDDIVWHNFDDHLISSSVIGDETFHIWDMTTTPDSYSPEFSMVERFDFILLNHVLMAMNDYQVHNALINLHRCLKPGGELEVIDMDLGKVFEAYREERINDIPIEHGSLDRRICHAIDGFGTRKSVFTIDYMREVLQDAGFRSSGYFPRSEYDTRPKESLILKAVK